MRLRVGRVNILANYIDVDPVRPTVRISQPNRCKYVSGITEGLKICLPNVLRIAISRADVAMHTILVQQLQ